MIAGEVMANYLIKDLIKNKKVVFFDLDGTLINSEELHFHALKKLFIKLEVEIKNPEEFAQINHGLPDKTIYSNYSFLHKISLKEYLNQKNQILADLINNLSHNEIEKITTRGLHNIFNFLKQNNMKLVVVSASTRFIIETSLKALGIFEYIETYFGEEDTYLSKPFPSPYLNAFRILNIQSSSALIFEDSHPGTKAAFLSGGHVHHISCFCPTSPLQSYIHSSSVDFLSLF